MELKSRLNLLIQSAKAAQEGGVLSLDDAVVVKKAIDVIEDGSAIFDGVNVLSKIVHVTQRKGGVFSLKDAFLLYLALDGIEKEIENAQALSDENKKGEE